ncbi:MAG: anti-sigma factor [Thermoleophilia bacterium]|nr:anti-sigma factor [Thermoleophilia bacterium]
MRVNDTDLHELAAAYALDALDDDDRAAFERHLAACEQCAHEVASFRETAASLAYAVDAPAPPAELRGRILDAARADRPNVVPLPRRWTLPALGGVAAVAAVAALALGVWSVSLSSQLDDERSAREATERALAFAADPDAARTELTGAEGSLVVGEGRSAALVVCRLAEAPGGKTYEAWVIQGGRPQPAGVFDGGAGCRAVPLERPVPAGATVAVTIEDGRVAQPTGEPVITAEPA